MALKMAADATLGDVMPMLHDPMSYLLRIKPKMQQCMNQHGGAVLRIGRRGSGQYPCFRVAYDVNGAEELFGTFIDSGKPIPSKSTTSVRWSTKVTGHGEFLDLLKAFQSPVAA